MTRITIFGAGITGLSIASVLPDATSITIVARDLPGDEPNQNWASPWACAGWVGLGGTPREKQMQLDALAFLRRLAHESPESSARCVTLRDIFPPLPEGVVVEDGGEGDGEKKSGVWYEDVVPFFRKVRGFEEEEGNGEKGKEDQGSPHAPQEREVEHESVVLDPSVFLPWLKKRLEATGVKFQRIGEIKALAELKYLGHDVLVNASGLASRTLEDVKDELMVMDRTYTSVVKSDYKGGFVHRGPGVYTYVFGRGDGTAVVGGISDPVLAELKGRDEVHADLFQRAHERLPEHFPSANPGNYEVVKDLVGIRPLRPAGVRVETEELNGQTVVHAYGTTIGGYIFSFGLAQEVARLVKECLSKP